MGVGYKPVLWNRQKRIYDKVMIILILLYLIVFIGCNFIFFPEVTIETAIIRAFGTLAFVMLHIILMIGPLCRLNPKFLPLLYNRRHLGVTMFFMASVHAIFSIVQFHALGDTFPILSIFTSNTHYGSLVNFPFQTLGFFALIILFLMAATSHDFWLHNLSPRVWKGLHMMVYVAYALLIMHVMLGTIQLESSPVNIVLLGGGMMAIIGLHLLAGFKEVAADKETQPGGNGGFVKVCELDEIDEYRAKMISVGEDKIAIFKYDGKLSAVANACKHQNGPLGEGKIVDGCITCPWHGYQYLPHNGCSPPPFEEKVATYKVKIEGTVVYVNPMPFPEGMEVEPAIF